MIESKLAPRGTWSPLRWLLVGEVLIFATAAHLALGPHPAPAWLDGASLVQWQLATALGFGVVMTLVLHALGMHVVRSRRSGVQLVLKYVLCAIASAALLWLVVRFAVVTEPQTAHLLTSLSLGFALLLFWRLVLNVVIDSEAMARNVLVLGAGKRALGFRNSMRRRSDRRGLELVGFVPLPSDDGDGIEQGLQLHSRVPLPRLCERNRIDEIVIASDDRRGGLPLNELLECRFRGITVTQAASFVERECGRIPIEIVEPSWWLYRSGFAEGAAKRRLKLAFDFLAASLILLLAAPVMLACALAIVLEDGWRSSVFFRQVRVGRNGRHFRLVKFRSMREDAESDGVARWARSDDDRITRVGRFLRKTRLDELPQLFNVLRGEMSLVGPRPERPEFVKDLARQIPYYEQRHAMRPGITGWAQLCYPYGASVRDAQEKLKFDLYYIKNHTLQLDVTILLRTVEVVLFGKGAR